MPRKPSSSGIRAIDCLGCGIRASEAVTNLVPTPKLAQVNGEHIKRDPEPKDTSTCFIERQNLTLGVEMHRFARLANAFSKRIEDHGDATSLYSRCYNFRRGHEILYVCLGQAQQYGASNRGAP